MRKPSTVSSKTEAPGRWNGGLVSAGGWGTTNTRGKVYRAFLTTGADPRYCAGREGQEEAGASATAIESAEAGTVALRRGGA